MSRVWRVGAWEIGCRRGASAAAGGWRSQPCGEAGCSDYTEGSTGAGSEITETAGQGAGEGRGLTVVATAILAHSASAGTYVPPAGQVFEGVNDTAVAQDFADFAGLLGKPHLGHQSAGGTRPLEGLPRGGVLSISTAGGWGLPEVTTPRQIAIGEGDDYLLSLNSRIARSGEITYIRPLAEPNNSHNAYSAVSLGRAAKGGDHSQAWYRLAWQRMYLIVKGGVTRAAIDQRLVALGLPPIQQRSKAALSATLASPRVAFIWCLFRWQRKHTRVRIPPAGAQPFAYPAYAPEWAP